MSSLQQQKFTKFTPIALMGVIALIGGVFFTVLTVQRNQDVRSRAAGTPQTMTLRPIADAHVTSSEPSTNKGYSSSLGIETGSKIKTSYIKYDLSSLAGKRITNVAFSYRVEADPEQSTGYHTVRVVDDNSWTESGITYNNRPTVSGVMLGTVSGPSTYRSYTSTLQSAPIQAKAGGLFSMAIQGSGDDYLAIQSRENTTYPPQLIITYDEGSEVQTYPTSPVYPPVQPTSTYPNQSTISLVQSKLYYNYYNSSGSVTLPQSVTAGNLIVVAVSNSLGSVSVRDTAGNTYRQAAVIPSSGIGQGQINIFYAENARGGATTITAQSTGNTYVTSVSLAAYEYAGAAKTNALDKTSAASGTSQFVGTGVTQQTSQNYELLFAAGTYNSSSTVQVTGASGFTIRNVQVDHTRAYVPLFTQDRFVTASGAYAGQFNLSNFSCGSSTYGNSSSSTYGGNSSSTYGRNRSSTYGSTYGRSTYGSTYGSTSGGCATYGAIVTFKAETVYPPTPTPTVYYAPTPTPTVYYAPTPTPTVYYAPTPTPTVYYAPTPRPTTIVYYPTPTPTTYYYPTPTPTVYYAPTPTTVYPTSTPIPTPTIQPYSTTVAFTLGMHGIGNGGDNVNPNGTGNTQPAHPQRLVTIDLLNASNVVVKSQTGIVAYDPASGFFKGVISLGTSIITGPYTIKIKTDQFLRSVIPGIQVLTAGQSHNLTQTALVTGDVNNDNQVNILDYNLLMGCYSDLLPPVSCPAGQDLKADLTDDSHVNQFDYNLFLRELTNRGGQ